MAYVNPATRDLVLTLSRDLRRAGSPTFDEFYHRLTTERGSCFWDRAFGSTLHELAQAKIGATFQADLEHRVRTALKPMLDGGRVRDLAFTHERVETNRWHAQITASDAASVPLAFDLFVEVG